MIKCVKCRSEFDALGEWEEFCWICAYMHEYNQMSHWYSLYQGPDFDNYDYVSSSEYAKYWGDTEFENDDIP